MLVFCESVDSTKQGGTAVMKLPSLMIFLNRQGRFCLYSYNFGGVNMKETNKKMEDMGFMEDNISQKY